MPDRQSYDEAMLFARVRLKVPDPDLKQGKVETYTLQSALGPYERPWGIEGGFAVVYKFRAQSGRLRALRCYRVTMNDDTQFRYERLSPYFRTYAPSITADFTYHRDAILVKEQSKPQPQTFPMIEMDWIEGDTLIDRVETLCQQRNGPALARLAQEWLRVLKMMQQAHIAHGDLAGVNVMVHDDATLVLIDYDGVYIPPLAGLPQTLLGQVDYQHPDVARRAYDEHMDDFSALVIYTALLALSVQPALWYKYSKHNAAGKLQDTNLLFTQDDFKRPQQSTLFRELESIGDQRLSAFTRALKQASQEPIDRIRFPFDLIDPVFLRTQAMNALEQAILADDDELIVARWVPALEQYEPARKHQERLRLARQRLQLLTRFRDALRQGNLQHIASSYDTELDTVRAISGDERELLAFARACVRAYQSGNVEAFLQIVDDRQYAQVRRQVTFTPQERQALNNARQLRQALQNLQEALRRKEIATIAAIRLTIPDVAQKLGDEERHQVELLAELVRSCSVSNDIAILAAYEELQRYRYEQLFPLPELLLQRIAQAQARQTQLTDLRVALQKKSASAIATAFDAQLETSTLLTGRERELAKLTRDFVHALDQPDDNALYTAYTALQRASLTDRLLFTEQEQAHIERMQQRRTSLLQVQHALKTRQPQQIASASDSQLEASTLLSAQEKELVQLARQFVHGIATDSDEALISFARALNRRDLFQFSEQELQRVELAERRYAASEPLRRVLTHAANDAEQIASAHNDATMYADIRLSEEQQAMVDAARSYVVMREVIQMAIRDGDDDVIQKVYNAELARRFGGFGESEQKQIDRALLSKALEELLEQGDNGQAIRMAQQIQQLSGRELPDGLKFGLRKAIMRFIRQQDLSHLIVSIKQQAGGNHAVAQWQWPLNSLVQDGLIVWSPLAWPQRPQEQRMRAPDPWHIIVRRKSDQAQGTCVFPIGPNTHIYVQAFAALADYWDQDRTWRFSGGVEATSKTEAVCPTAHQ